MGVETGGPAASAESGGGTEGASSINYNQLYQEANPGSNPIDIGQASAEAYAAAPAMDKALEHAATAENIVASAVDAPDPVSAEEHAAAVQEVRGHVQSEEAQRYYADQAANDAGTRYQQDKAQSELHAQEQASRDALMRGKGVGPRVAPAAPKPDEEEIFDPLANATWPKS